VLDGVRRDDGIVDQEAQRDDERRDADLLNVESEQLHEPERERQRDRDAHREHQRRVPLEEADEGDDHDEPHRLEETAHEEVDVLHDLPGLIARARDDEVLGERPAHVVERRVDLGAEVSDLRAGAHEDAHRDGTRSLPLPAGSPPRVAIEEHGGALVAAMHVDDVT
jgi:hypothetical protein